MELFGAVSRVGGDDALSFRRAFYLLRWLGDTSLCAEMLRISGR